MLCSGKSYDYVACEGFENQDKARATVDAIQVCFPQACPMFCCADVVTQPLVICAQRVHDVPGLKP